jgi:hypothetical protein
MRPKQLLKEPVEIQRENFFSTFIPFILKLIFFTNINKPAQNNRTK